MYDQLNQCLRGFQLETEKETVTGVPMSRCVALCMIALLVCACTAGTAAGASGGKGAVVEREKRFLRQALDDLAASQRLALEDVDELSRQRDAINLLEPDRGDALRDLLEWNNRYLEWLTGEEAELEGELARLSAPRAAGERRLGNFDEMVTTTQALAQELGAKVAAFDEVRNALAAIINRQRLLQAEIADLGGRVARLRSGESDPARPSEKERREEAHLTRKIRTVQSELATLPNVDPEVLGYYAVLGEQGRWQGEWLAFKIGEYKTFGELAELTPHDAPGDLDALAQAYQRLNRSCRREAGLLARKIDELDRKRTRVTPTGTPGELDRARNLKDLYERLRQRYDSRIRELKVLAGTCDAEVSELRSLQR